MAFPTTPVLDTFTDALAPRALPTYNPAWATALSISDFLTTTDATIQRPDADNAANYWQTFNGQDAEAYISMPVAIINSTFRIGVRVQDPASSLFNGYLLQISTVDFRLESWIAGSQTTTIASGVHTPFDNDRYGVCAIGDQISCYLYRGGSWTTLGQGTDTDITGSGTLLIRRGATGGADVARFDDFGGGAPVPNTDVMVPHLLGRSAGW